MICCVCGSVVPEQDDEFGLFYELIHHATDGMEVSNNIFCGADCIMKNLAWLIEDEGEWAAIMQYGHRDRQSLIAQEP